jgi:hypothetical protein
MGCREPYFLNVDDLKAELQEFGEELGERIDSLREELGKVLEDAELVESLSDGAAAEAIRLLSEAVDASPANPYDSLSIETAIDYWNQHGVRERLRDAFSLCHGGVDERLADLACAANDLDDMLADRVSDMREIIELLDNVQDAGRIYREDQFAQHAQGVADDVFGLDVTRWPATCIDWEKAADELRQDYTSIEFRGEDWLYRE